MISINISGNDLIIIAFILGFSGILIAANLRR